MCALKNKKCLISIILLLYLQPSKCDIISEKCEEYGEAVFSEQDSPVLARSSRKNRVSECGIVSVPLIVGGSRAAEKEFPHMAIIGFGDSPNSNLAWDCGGSLISEWFVLTAGHCLESREKGPAQKIRLGITNIESLGPELQERLVGQKFRHPDYNPPLKANDIALIKLDMPVEFTPHVRPACLNKENIRLGRKGLASGFGKLSHNAEHGSKNLMKVFLQIYGNDQCSKYLTLKEPIIDTMLCAGQLAGGKDTCQGDSGGPFQIVLDKPYCMYSLIGITSFGKFCGFPNSPAIYTKISSFLPWIQSIVWN